MTKIETEFIHMEEETYPTMEDKLEGNSELCTRLRTIIGIDLKPEIDNMKEDIGTKCTKEEMKAEIYRLSHYHMSHELQIENMFNVTINRLKNMESEMDTFLEDIRKHL